MAISKRCAGERGPALRGQPRPSSLEKQEEIETAPSLRLRRHTRTVRLPPLPAFVFLPPKHFWPLALAAVGLRVDDKRKYTLKTVFWRRPRTEELLRKNGSWETSLQGQCHSLACLGFFKKCNSHLAFQGRLRPPRIVRGAEWAQLGCWASFGYFLDGEREKFILFHFSTSLRRHPVPCKKIGVGRPQSWAPPSSWSGRAALCPPLLLLPNIVQSVPGEVSSDVSASKAAQVSPQLHGFRVLSSRRPGGRTSAQRRSPRASGSAESPRTPADSREEGVSPRAGLGVRRPAGTRKGRWIPGKTKALPEPADP